MFFLGLAICVAILLFALIIFDRLNNRRQYKFKKWEEMISSLERGEGVVIIPRPFYGVESQKVVYCKNAESAKAVLLDSF